MYESPLQSNEARQLQTILNGVDHQLRRSMDSVRARQFWRGILVDVPPEVIAQALAMALSSNQYQAVPECTCGCHRHCR